MIATLPGVFAAAAAPAPPRGGTGAVARCPRAHLCRSVAWRPQPTADESKKSLPWLYEFDSTRLVLASTTVNADCRIPFPPLLRAAAQRASCRTARVCVCVHTHITCRTAPASRCVVRVTCLRRQCWRRSSATVRGSGGGRPRVEMRARARAAPRSTRPWRAPASPRAPPRPLRPSNKQRLLFGCALPRPPPLCAWRPPHLRAFFYARVSRGIRAGRCAPHVPHAARGTGERRHKRGGAAAID